MFDLTGKTALVTGASGGIGEAIAAALHGQGATLALSGTRAEKLDQLAGDLGQRTHVLPCDLFDSAAVDALPKQAEEAMGQLDILVNNAGITRDNLFMRMKDEVATGQRLQQAMENTDLFPNMVIQMIAVGEESGSLDEMSAKVADFYEEDVDNAVDNLSSLLEPLIMAILGVLVGGLVVAMYLPIFKMGSVI